MTSRLPTITAFHDGGELSSLQRLSISSFLAQGHGYHLYTYAPVTGLPDGAERRDAGALVAEAHSRAPDGSRLRSFPNRICWELMAERGAEAGRWWATLDTICLRALDFERSPTLGFADFNHIAPSPLRVDAEHPIARAMLRRHRRPELFPYDGIGKCLAIARAAARFSRAPLRAFDDALLVDDRLLTLEVMRRRESLRVRPPSDFNPLPAVRRNDAFDGSWPDLASLEDSYTLRLHNPPPSQIAGASPDSLFAELLRLHGEKV